ncbi:FAD-binding oxidoreductase [Nocardiopsis trehalosi]|jgi:FAD/FMN-containing dehydrogenase|uniref:FAD-binding oxidoreductase n=1 Tax=Nocardiopsis trehalosi TaxID=109329 RepID=UPI00082A3BFC|nr:FAD-binding oxidoreductase [Nocardiopsis trehalosi]
MNGLRTLRSALRGPVLLDGDPGFDAARRPWNRAVGQPVAAVARPVDADDAAAAVRHARSTGLTLAAQASGHGATGDVDGVVLLRTGALDGLSVDPVARTARVGAGVSWGRVQAAAAEHGLTGLAGSSPVVSVTGYTLGGGLSWFGRAHGWAADSVLAFEVVDADGVRSRVTADSDPDLFWALRGGGGDVALVTEVEFRLHPAPELYGGRMLWPIDRAPEVVDAFRRVTAAAPDRLTVWLDLLRPPGRPACAAVLAAHLGPAAEARALLRPFDAVSGRLSDDRRALSPADLGAVGAEPTAPGAGVSRGVPLTGLDDAAAVLLAEGPPAPLLRAQVRHLGGALAGPSDTPYGPLAAPYGLHLLGVPAGPGSAAAVRAAQAAVVRGLGPAAAGRTPPTWLGPGESAADAYAPEALDRLRALKRSRDPRGVFRGNFPLFGRPATGPAARAAVPVRA